MGRTIRESIGTIKGHVPPEKSIRPYEEVPEVPGLPIAGNAFEMAGDVRGFLARNYRKHGPIFRIRAFGYRFIALVGPEANVFVSGISGTHLRSYEPYREFGVAMGAHRIMLNMDGPEHLRMRKLQVNGYSPKTIESRLDVAYDTNLREIGKWPQGRPLGGQRAMPQSPCGFRRSRQAEGGSGSVGPRRRGDGAGAAGLSRRRLAESTGHGVHRCVRRGRLVSGICRVLSYQDSSGVCTLRRERQRRVAAALTLDSRIGPAKMPEPGSIRCRCLARGLATHETRKWASRRRARGARLEEHPEAGVLNEIRQQARDGVRVISGGPGAGENTLLEVWFRRWARSLPKPYLDCRSQRADEAACCPCSR